jgi:hypothetical protein
MHDEPLVGTKVVERCGCAAVCNERARFHERGGCGDLVFGDAQQDSIARGEKFSPP